MRLTLEISEKQADILVKALDTFGRIGMAQYKNAITDNLSKFDYSMEDIIILCNKIKRVIYPELDSNAYYGIAQLEDKYKIAFEMYQTVRQKLSYYRNPEGGFSVNFDNPFKISEEPLPIVCISEKSKTTYCKVCGRVFYNCVCGHED